MLHDEKCNFAFFENAWKDCIRFYECVTRVYCTLFNWIFGCCNPEGYFLRLMEPVANLLTTDFKYFAAVIEGISIGLKGSFNEIFLS